MRSIPERHIRETYSLVKKISKEKIAKWLFEQGYYPEQYVLPPCFEVSKLRLKRSPYYPIIRTGRKVEYKPNYEELIKVTFPKSKLTDRTFGIIHPKIYHDIVFHLINEWDLILKTIFDSKNKIFSYSFPIPVNKKNKGELSPLRAGRMIYEFLEMAEKDLVAEAHKYKYLVTTDIKNFYPSIYTHSIAWAFHTKIAARADRNRYNLLGNIIDKLFQSANDGCTNGIPIGSAVSDLISEVLLAAIDKDCSKVLMKADISFIGVRFKDDYRFLCNSKSDAEKILSSLQNSMRNYNLGLNEGKSEIRELPEGLFRPWISEYYEYSLRNRRNISYKVFENTLLAVLKLDKSNPDVGVIDKFLSELVSKNYNLKLSLDSKQVLKAFSLLIMLKERRAKAFPFILAIIELILEKHKKKSTVISQIKYSLNEILNECFQKNSEVLYDLLWLTYFVKSNKLFTLKWKKPNRNDLLKSIKSNSQQYFVSDPDIVLFKKILKPSLNKKLVKHLAVFPKEE